MEMRWIPVEEAMPKANEKVLVATYNQYWNSYNVIVAEFTGEGNRWSKGSGNCVDHIFSGSDAANKYNVHIVAWMEIPKYEEII